MANLNILSDFNLVVNPNYSQQLWSVHFIVDDSSHLFPLKYGGKNEYGNHVYYNEKKLSIPKMDFQIMIIENEKTNHLNIKFDGSKLNNNKIHFFSDIFEFTCFHHQAFLIPKSEYNPKPNYLFNTVDKIKLLQNEIIKLKNCHQQLKSDYVDLQLKHYLATRSFEEIIDKQKSILAKIK